MSKAGELDMRVSNMEGEIKRSRDAIQRLESTFARLEEVADCFIRMIEAKFAGESPEDGGSNFSNTPEVELDRTEYPWSTTENHQQEASQMVKKLERQKIREESSGVITLELESEGTKEEHAFQQSRSSDLQEKSLTIFDRSPQRESDLNVDVALPDDNRERAGWKRQESGVEFRPEFEHLGPPPWSRERRDKIEVSQSEVGAIDVRQIGIDSEDALHFQICDSTRRKMDENKGGTAKEDKLEVDHHGDCWLNREERAREFEKAVMKAARETRSENTIWVVGFNSFEPVFFLVMGDVEFGSDGWISAPLGPPPWFAPFEALKPIFHRCTKEEIMRWKSGTSLILLGPITWPKSLKGGARDSDSGFPLGPLGPPTWPKYFIREVTHLDKITGGPNEHPFDRLQPLSYELVKFQPPPQTQNRRRRRPPIHQPPPKPPDFYTNLPRFVLISTSSEPPAAYSPISLRINGKNDAAGHDPSDVQFYQIPMSWKLILAIATSLEDKADFKGSVRALIRTREGCLVENCCFELPRPPEPPLSWVSPCGVATMKCNDPVVAQWLEEPIPMALRMDYVTSLEVKALLNTWANARKSAHCWIGDRKEAASIDPGDSLLAYLTGAVISVCVELILEGEVSKLADHGCTIQEDGDEDNLMLQLVYHSPRPPEFETNIENPLSDRNRNIQRLSLSKEIDAGIQRLSLSMQGLITKDHETDSKTWRCTMEFHGQSSYYNLEDKVVLKEGEIVRYVVLGMRMQNQDKERLASKQGLRAVRRGKCVKKNVRSGYAHLSTSVLAVR